MPHGADAFVFQLSCDVDAQAAACMQVCLRVDQLLGLVPLLHSGHNGACRPSSLYVTAELSSSGHSLGVQLRTPFAECAGQGPSWDSLLKFPIKYRDLGADSQLALTIWERAEGYAERALGGTTVRMFSKKGRLKTGRQLLKVWLDQRGDLMPSSETPGKQPLCIREEIGRLGQVVKQHSRNEIDHVDWLDSLTLVKIGALHQEEIDKHLKDRLLLEVQLAEFQYAVVFQEAALPSRRVLNATASGIQRGGALGQAPSDTQSLIILQDPEVGLDNPSEKKAQKLARSATRGLVDRNLKPDVEERRRIAALLLLPPNRAVSTEDKSLLWRFRWSLTGEKRALTKVLQAVDWADAQETQQALELIELWTAIDIADALELLSPAFTHPEVRGYAVEVLKRTDDEELRYYLLQLVQALRYEVVDNSKLATFIVERASKNPVIGVLLHWYLCTEWSDPNFGPRAAYVQRRFNEAAGDTQTDISLQIGLMARLRFIVSQLKMIRGGAVKKAEKLREMLEESGDLSELHCALPLDPSVHLAGIISQECSVFKSALSPLRLTFRTVGQDGQAQPDPDSMPAASSEDEAVAPVDPEAPARQVPDEGRYIVIYKRGDDLRQDQLVVQMFSLMDRLLKRENLDLCLTPYRVLPTSSEDGLIEFIPSVAMARVLADHKTIQRYFAMHNPDPTGPFGLKAEVVDTFVRSCAGYCVMTYILGIGDRHLDNLMLTTDGRLFHIDFGFIMGQDPKPFPPPMKLNKEMIDGMGGSDSDHYRKFRTLACEAYNILRKSASLLVSLFHLMAGASIPDVQSDPEKAILKLQEKLRLDVDEETAVEWMQQLINESSSALMPAIMEQGHRIAQYWR